MRLLFASLIAAVMPALAGGALAGVEGGRAIFTVDSGEYAFQAPSPKGARP